MASFVARLRVPTTTPSSTLMSSSSSASVLAISLAPTRGRTFAWRRDCRRPQSRSCRLLYLVQASPAPAPPPPPPLPPAGASPPPPPRMAKSSSNDKGNKTHLHALDLSPAAAAKEKPFGPRGVLLVGLDAADAAAAERWFRQMEPEEDALPISHCSGAMLEQTVEEAVLSSGVGGGRRGGGEAGDDSNDKKNASSSSFASIPFVSKPDEKLPRLALLSGMSSAESVAVAQHWEQFARSRKPVVAALMPAMVRRKLGDVVLEATLAAASASSSSSAEESKAAAERSVIDAESIRERVKASVEARRATRATGPIRLVVQPRGPPPAAPPPPPSSGEGAGGAPSFPAASTSAGGASGAKGGGAAAVVAAAPSSAAGAARSERSSNGVGGGNQKARAKGFGKQR